ncbi:uncharacterized protein [Vicugna pacos]|uniref:Uncharacterized protein n=1 Tax=Vicugna pacos TaxID=30538 RepID=A0ABM5CTF2_VICPA
MFCVLSTATLACSCHPGAANRVPPLPSPCLGTAGAKNLCYDLRFRQEVKEQHWMTPNSIRNRATGEEMRELDILPKITASWCRKLNLNPSQYCVFHPVLPLDSI